MPPNAPSSRRRLLTLGGAMLATAAAADLGRPQRREGQALPPLNDIFPRTAGAWTTDSHAEAFVQPPAAQARAYGIYDQVLERHYLDARGQRIMLSVAYGGEQSESLQVHRPEVCYAGSGFRVGPVSTATLTAAGRTLPVRRLMAEAPGRPEPVTYWVVLGNEVLADDSQLRWRRIAAGLRGELLDGLLVRVSSLQRDPQAAWQLHATFAADLAAALAPQWQPRVLGRA